MRSMTKESMKKTGALAQTLEVLPVFFERIHSRIHRGDYVDAMMTARRICEILGDHTKHSQRANWAWLFAKRCEVEMKHWLNRAMHRAVGEGHFQ